MYRLEFIKLDKYVKAPTYLLHYNPITNPIKDPVKGTLVPLRTNFNANGSVRWRTSLYLNLFHWQMGKNYGDGNGVCRYVRAQKTKPSTNYADLSMSNNMNGCSIEPRRKWFFSNSLLL